MRKLYWAVSVLLAVAVPSVALAVDIPAASQLPASTDASRVGQQLPKLQSGPNLRASGAVREANMPQAGVTPGADKIKFMLKQLNITGNTVYSYQELSPLFSRYVGKEITLAQLQEVAQQITLKYRSSGYVLSRAVVPAQTINNGVVTIQVIEGYVGHVNCVCNAAGSGKLVNAYGQKIAQSKPLHINTLERYALLANDIPGMNLVKTVLQPPTDPNAPLGSTDLTMVPDFSKASGFVSYDNRGTKYLGQNEFSAGGTVNSIIQSGDQFGVQGLITPSLGEQYVNAFDTQPIGITGATFNLSASYSKTEPGYTLAPLLITGVSKEVVATLKAPIIRSRKQSLYASLAYDYLNTRSDIGIVVTNPLYEDHIRSARFGLDYYVQDGWAGADQASAQISQGLSIMQASSPTDLFLSRVQGDPQYTKYNGTLSRLQGITQNTSLLIAGIGQYTNVPLLSSEQFAFGGAQYGQAYDPAEITGDRGVAGKAELRYNTHPALRFLTAIQYFAFYDIGKVWNILPQSVNGLPQEQSGSSTGVGFRVNFNQYVYGSAEIAQPLTRQVATNQSYAPRFFVSLTVSGKTPSVTCNGDGSLPGIDRPPVGYTSGAATNGPTAQRAAAGMVDQQQ